MEYTFKNTYDTKQDLADWKHIEYFQGLQKEELSHFKKLETQTK